MLMLSLFQACGAAMEKVRLAPDWSSLMELGSCRRVMSEAERRLARPVYVNGPKYYLFVTTFVKGMIVSGLCGPFDHVPNIVLCFMLLF